MRNSKSKVVMVLFGREQVDQFISTGVLNDLEQTCDVSYFISDSTTIQDRSKVEGKPVKIVPFNDGLWSAYSSILQKLFLSRAVNSSATYNIIFTQSFFKRFLCKLFCFPSPTLSIYALLKQIDRLWIDLEGTLYRELEKQKPALVIVPIATVKAYHFEIIHFCRKLGIRSVFVPSGWDNVTSKMLLYETPDHFWVWGDQMVQQVINVFKLQKSKVQIIGVPQYEEFLKETIRDLQRGELFKSQYGLPLDKRIVLFAGSIRAFDEISLLQRLDIFIKLRFPDLHLFYRPHPLRDRRIYEPDIQDCDFHHVTIDPSFDWKNQSVDSGNGLKAQKSFDYIGLYQAIDGVISPFSTVILEGALFGKPCLGIGYNDGVHFGPKAAENMAKTEHFGYINEQEWFVSCSDSNSIEPCLHELVQKMDQPDIASQIKKSTEYIVKQDTHSCSERISSVVKSLLY